MYKCAILICAFLAIVTAQGVHNLQWYGVPIQVSPNQTYTTNFVNHYGSQFSVWIPSNVSRVFLTWTRSASDNNGCDSSDYAYVYGKWVTYPCAYGYSISTQCAKNQDDFGYSSSYPLEIALNAYSGESLYYWDYMLSSNGEDFLRGEWLYLDSYIDIDSNCTASLQVSFDYCPAGTIAAYEKNGGNGYDTTCVPYTNVDGLTYNQNAVTIPSATSKYYLINVPSNVSGISFVLQNANYISLQLYARPSSGGGYGTYYSYAYTYDTQISSGIYNYSLWVPNPSPGEWVLTIEDYFGSTGLNFTFDVEIKIKTCPSGITADKAGNCLYPLTPVTAAQLANFATSVLPYNPAVNQDCNCAYYAYTSAANTYAYLNMTFTLLGSYNRVFWRKNAIPSFSFYDDYIYANTTVYFTPEDFYSNKPVTYYFGFCNYDQTANATFTVTASSFVAGPSPSPQPGASASPVAGASPSPASASSSPGSVPSASSSPGSGSSSGQDSSSAYSLGISLLLVLACVVLLF